MAEKICPLKKSGSSGGSLPQQFKIDKNTSPLECPAGSYVFIVGNISGCTSTGAIELGTVTFTQGTYTYSNMIWLTTQDNPTFNISLWTNNWNLAVVYP